MILGIGIDLVNIERISKVFNRWGIRFQKRIFTPEEVRYCQSQRLPILSYAVRFAAKEATIKALGNNPNFNWREIEVISKKNKPPLLKIYGRTKAIAKEKKIRHIFLSLSHTSSIAAAIVLVEG
jgi:holo-[acyl-carrier protein] synthase